MKKIESYQELADVWNAYKRPLTPETDVVLEVTEYGVLIWPAETNQQDVIYMFDIDRVVDFARVFDLHYLVKYDKDRKKICLRMYSNDINRLRREK